MKKYTQQTTKDEVRTWINTNLTNYLKNNDENVSEIEHIIDYLNSDKAPNRLQKASYKEMKSNSEKWVKALIKKGNNIVETEQDVNVEIRFDNGFKLVKLVSDDSYNREGSLMSHCVGSYSSRDCEIFSLRDANNQPHCTMEIVRDNNNINQLKGKGNGSIHPNYIGMVIDSIKHFGMELRESEVSNLGYSKLSDNTWELLDKEFSDIKEMSFSGSRFFYNNQKLTKAA